MNYILRMAKRCSLQDSMHDLNNIAFSELISIGNHIEELLAASESLLNQVHIGVILIDVIDFQDVRMVQSGSDSDVLEKLLAPLVCEQSLLDDADGAGCTSPPAFAVPLLVQVEARHRLGVHIYDVCADVHVLSKLVDYDFAFQQFSLVDWLEDVGVLGEKLLDLWVVALLARVSHVSPVLFEDRFNLLFAFENIHW